ncbi:hypothetical protein AB9N12_07085 [Bacteroides sp. AN502(2024)]|uniref:hypothetical protein n=1 Tax=Bacteroides sp. AN502(2024) TaxID=3160599 RepID=UPI003518BE10
MNIKSFLLTAFAASMTLVACDKSENLDNPNSDKMPKSVTIKLPNIQKTPSVRSTGDAMANNSQVELKNFKVFFVDANGNVQTVPKYEGSEQQTYFSSDATDGSWSAIGEQGKDITYHFLPAATSKVVVVGNIGNVEYSTLAAKTEAVPNDTEAGHPTYSLYGDSELTEKTTEPKQDVANHENVYTATVTLEPRVSRFEIYGFEYQQATAPATNKYTSVALEKIALNHYYTQYDFVTKTPEEDGKVWDNPTKETAWTWIENRTDWCDALNLSLEPGDKKFVDGTTITDPNEDGEEATGIITYGLAHVESSTNNPELLLALRGNTADNASTPLYLHGKFTSKDPFVSGKIYRVFFTFDDENLSQPERCVELNVKVANWTVVPVTPEF